MNISDQKSAVYRNETSSEKTRMFSFGRNPFVDWTWIIIISCLLLIFFLTVDVFAYESINDAAYGNETTQTVPTRDSLDTVSLTQAVSLFQIRAKTYDSLIQGYVGPRDPSL